MSIRETQQKLESWGRWVSGGTGLGYGNVLQGLRGGGLPSARISDDHALRIDRVIAVLKRTNREHYQCIKLCYANRMSESAIAREVGLSKATVSRRLDSAEHWIDAAFEAEKI